MEKFVFVTFILSLALSSQAFHPMPFSLDNPFRHFNPFFGRYIEGNPARAYGKNALILIPIEINILKMATKKVNEPQQKIH